MTLTPLVLSGLFLQCAPDIAPQTLNAVVSVESARNPYVVANVTDNTSHYFAEKEKATAFLNKLESDNKNYSAGIMQINSANFKTLGLNNNSVLDPCINIRAGAVILKRCWNKAISVNPDEQKALRDAMSCYYSGNFTRGYKKEATDGKSYIQRIEEKTTVSSHYTVPAIRVDGQTENISPPPRSFMVTQNSRNEWDVFGDYSVSQEEDNNTQ
ncbi:lytic transglycosylase domain-containing protein [Salmonella enterica]|nr:lytic transglycosylase domain-containing protein [Salmonella enterica]ELY1197723.1 lytic transglycosylase domain-containing protein [Salmonella enterica]